MSALSRHHRKCKTNGGTNSSRNISVVPVVQHQAWHTLFQNYKAEKIAEIITETWCDPDYYFVAKRRV